MKPEKVVGQFVAAINAHDVERIASLMTPGHRFIDSLGLLVEGRDAVREGWQFYFSMVPDYNLSISHWFLALHGGDETIVAGRASGSYWSKGFKQPNSSWSTPVALRAIIREGRIAEWQVYADNEPIRERIRAASA